MNQSDSVTHEKILCTLKLTSNVKRLIGYKALNILAFPLKLCASNYAVLLGLLTALYAAPTLELFCGL